MSATNRRRLAKGMRWAARIIGLGETALLLFQWFFAQIFTEAQDRVAIANLSSVAAVIAVVGCFTSWWRSWLAGVLLIISWFTYSGWFIYKIAMGPLVTRSYFLGYLVFGSPLLDAGVLFLLSWWLSRKPSPSAPPPSPTS